MSLSIIGSSLIYIYLDLPVHVPPKGDGGGGGETGLA